MPDNFTDDISPKSYVVWFRHINYKLLKYKYYKNRRISPKLSMPIDQKHLNNLSDRSPKSRDPRSPHNRMLLHEQSNRNTSLLHKYLQILNDSTVEDANLIDPRIRHYFRQLFLGKEKNQNSFRTDDIDFLLNNINAELSGKIQKILDLNYDTPNNKIRNMKVQDSPQSKSTNDRNYKHSESEDLTSAKGIRNSSPECNEQNRNSEIESQNRSKYTTSPALQNDEDPETGNENYNKKFSFEFKSDQRRKFPETNESDATTSIRADYMRRSPEREKQKRYETNERPYRKSSTSENYRTKDRRILNNNSNDKTWHDRFSNYMKMYESTHNNPERNSNKRFKRDKYNYNDCFELNSNETSLEKYLNSRKSRVSFNQLPSTSNRYENKKEENENYDEITIKNDKNEIITLSNATEIMEYFNNENKMLEKKSQVEKLNENHTIASIKCTPQNVMKKRYFKKEYLQLMPYLLKYKYYTKKELNLLNLCKKYNYHIEIKMIYYKLIVTYLSPKCHQLILTLCKQLNMSIKTKKSFSPTRKTYTFPNVVKLHVWGDTIMDLTNDDDEDYNQNNDDVQIIEYSYPKPRNRNRITLINRRMRPRSKLIVVKRLETKRNDVNLEFFGFTMLPRRLGGIIRFYRKRSRYQKPDQQEKDTEQKSSQKLQVNINHVKIETIINLCSDSEDDDDDDNKNCQIIRSTMQQNIVHLSRSVRVQNTNGITPKSHTYDMPYSSIPSTSSQDYQPMDLTVPGKKQKTTNDNIFSLPIVNREQSAFCQKRCNRSYETDESAIKRPRYNNNQSPQFHSDKNVNNHTCPPLLNNKQKNISVSDIPKLGRYSDRSVSTGSSAVLPTNSQKIDPKINVDDDIIDLTDASSIDVETYHSPGVKYDPNSGINNENLQVNSTLNLDRISTWVQHQNKTNSSPQSTIDESNQQYQIRDVNNAVTSDSNLNSQYTISAENHDYHPSNLENSIGQNNRPQYRPYFPSTHNPTTNQHPTNNELSSHSHYLNGLYDRNSAGSNGFGASFEGGLDINAPSYLNDFQFNSAGAPNVGPFDAPTTIEHLPYSDQFVNIPTQYGPSPQFNGYVNNYPQHGNQFGDVSNGYSVLNGGYFEGGDKTEEYPGLAGFGKKISKLISDFIDPEKEKHKEGGHKNHKKKKGKYDSLFGALTGFGDNKKINYKKIFGFGHG